MSDSSSGKYSLAPSAVIQEVSQLVSKITGVQLGERQFVMVQTRLKKRMMDLHLNTEEEYLEFLRSNKTAEVEALVSLLTTHHTSFFREYSHFEYLEREGLPTILKAMKEKGQKTLRVWSAACSNGQEVYTLSMFLSYILPKMAPGVNYEIFGTDVAPQSVATAQNGVYLRKETKEIPLHFLADHWAKGSGDIADYVKAKKSIKDPCSFDTLNLLHVNEKLFARQFDLIFCRNVYIYFNSDQIKSITKDLLKHLDSHGLLVIGISESLNGLELPVTIRGPSIYSHPVVASALATKTAATATSAAALAPTGYHRPAILRVLCVDDSSSILTLLKQVLKKDAGFEVVGTAVNGLDAAKKVQELKPDVMTLDIHMPEQDGIEYLRSNIKTGHPPVIMVSSVSREASDLALKALELGASDYVEKPTLSNLAERGDEIRIKLNYAYQNRQQSQRPSLSLDKSFSTQPTIQNPEKKLRIVVAGLQNRKQLKELLSSFTGAQPPTLVLVEGADSSLTSISSQWIGEWGKPGHLLAAWPSPVKPGEIYLGDLTQLWSAIFGAREAKDKKKVSILIYGVVSKGAAEKVGQWTDAQILMEDLGNNLKDHPLHARATDWVPATSFAYMSAEFLGDDHG